MKGFVVKVRRRVVKHGLAMYRSCADASRQSRYTLGAIAPFLRAKRRCSGENGGDAKLLSQRDCCRSETAGGAGWVSLLSLLLMPITLKRCCFVDRSRRKILYHSSLRVTAEEDQGVPPSTIDGEFYHVAALRDCLDASTAGGEDSWIAAGEGVATSPSSYTVHIAVAAVHRHPYADGSDAATTNAQCDMKRASPAEALLTRPPRACPRRRRYPAFHRCQRKRILRREDSKVSHSRAYCLP